MIHRYVAALLAAIATLATLALITPAAGASTPDGAVLWRGVLTAQIVATPTGVDPFSPVVRLLGELGPTPAGPGQLALS